MEKTSYHKPMFKWSGGKYDELKHIDKHIPSKIEVYIEPFLGSGAVLWNTDFKQAHVTDVHTEVVDFFNSIKDGHGSNIEQFMMTHPNDEETYYQVRDKFKPSNQIECASRFYYLRKTCYRGMLRYNKSGQFNIPFGRYKTVDYTILSDQFYTSKLQTVTVELATYETMFKLYNDASNFMFLDPPYDSTFTDYGYCKFDKSDHERLARLVKETENRCLMVIGDTPFIRSLYDGYIIDEYHKRYKFKLHSGRVGSEINNKHLVVSNYT